MGDQHRPWHGTFQFLIKRGARGQPDIYMEGRWIGFSSNGEMINAGAWEWTKPGQPWPSELK